MAGDDRDLSGPSPQLICPRCSAALLKHPTKSGFAARCSTCGGILIDRLALSGVSRDDAAELLVQVLESPMTGDVSCPACHRPMVEAKVDGVVIDACPTDGLLWFDSDELDPFRPGLFRPSPGSTTYGRIPGGRVPSLLAALMDLFDW